jgi:anti-sigma regulatory factor (Ser/Thr protein kinase)
VVQCALDADEGLPPLTPESETTVPALPGVRYRAEITSRGQTPGMRSEIYDIAIRAGFADRAADVAVALTELVANAQQHGDPPYLVEAWWDGRLVIEVSNHGTGLDQDSVWRSEPPRADEVRGRGLWLVRHLVDLVDVRTGTERTMVHVELSPEPHIGA